MTDGNVDTPDAVRRAALEIYVNDDLDDEDKKAELEGLYHTANENDIDITSEDIVGIIEERREANEAPATYESYRNQNVAERRERLERALDE
jgi:hypothetical protein